MALTDHKHALADREPGPKNLLGGVTNGEKLYHFLRMDRLLDLVSEKKIFLSRPRTWKDPFEDYLSKVVGNYMGEEFKYALTENFFAQCWTRKPECDGMWRNYCAFDAGVRIETTALKLLSAIWGKGDAHPSLHTFVGEVDYFADDEFLAEAKCRAEAVCTSDGVGMARTLLLKRAEFSYELEVRALVCDKACRPDTQSFAIEPTAFIGSIMFAPGVHKAACAAYTEWLVVQGFDRSIISRSSLYVDPVSIAI